MATINFFTAQIGDASEFQGTGGTFSYSAGTVRNGNLWSFRTNPTTTATGFGTLGTVGSTGAQATNVSAGANAFVILYFQYATKPGASDEPILLFRDTAAAQKLEIRLNSSGNLAAYDSAGTIIGSAGSTVLSSGTWYELKIKCGTGASAAWEVVINNISEISSSNANLGTTNHGSIRLGKASNRNGQTVDFYFSACLWDDTAYPKTLDTAIWIPSSAGAAQTCTRGGSDSGANWSQVNDNPPDGDTAYLVTDGASGDAETETLTRSDNGKTAGIPICVKVLNVVKRDGANNGSIANRMRSGSTNSDGGTYASTNAYTGTQKLSDTDPATSAAWLWSALNSVQSGLVEKTALARLTRLTSTSMMVAYAIQPTKPFVVNTAVSRAATY